MQQALKKILIIGMGSIGRRHLGNLLALGYHNIVCVEPCVPSAKRIEREFGIQVYPDVAIAFEKENPYTTFICSPTRFHVAHARLAATRRSHIFIEKPVSQSLAGLDSLISMVNKRKVVAMVACNYRFHKGWIALKKALDSGRYGKVLFAHVICGYYLPSARHGVNYKNTFVAEKNSGGVWLDSGIHMVDYLRNLLGDIKKIVLLKSKMHALRMESEEIAHAVFVHEAGITSALTLDYVRRSAKHELETVTEKGVMSLDFKGDFLRFKDESKTKLIYKGAEDINQMFVDELRHFFECIQYKMKPAQDLVLAKHNLEIFCNDEDK